MRIDKYLWCVRLFKTRSLSAKNVEAGNIKINGVIVKKSSKEIKIDQSFAIKALPIWRTYKVRDIPKSRVGAKLVEDLMIETTDEDDLKMLKQVQKENNDLRQKGMLGRPTKKNRRDLDSFWD
jgi:ribosome-associated heat shock protein Hsp15